MSDYTDHIASLMTLCEHPQFTDGCVLCAERCALIAATLRDEIDRILLALAGPRGWPSNGVTP